LEKMSSGGKSDVPPPPVDPSLATAFSRSLLRLLSKYGGTTHKVRDALAALDCHTDWSALIADLLLTDGSGLDVLATFFSKQATASATRLTGRADPVAINTAYDLRGDYVLKPLGSARIHRVLQTGMVGHVALSEGERKVLWRLSLGHESKVIASDLGLAFSTVRVVLMRISAKLGARSRAELLAKAATMFPPPAEDISRRKL